MKKLLLAILIGIVCSLNFSFVNVLAGTTYTQQVVVVHNGDTLWNIAQDWTEQDEDVRDVIDRIVVANKLASASAVSAGQKLIVPVRSEQANDLMMVAAARERK
jgi:uncharacterized protein YcgI (DUF1989 family)